MWVAAQGQAPGGRTVWVDPEDVTARVKAYGSFAESTASTTAAEIQQPFNFAPFAAAATSISMGRALTQFALSGIGGGQ